MLIGYPRLRGLDSVTQSVLNSIPESPYPSLDATPAVDTRECLISFWVFHGLAAKHCLHAARVIRL